MNRWIVIVVLSTHAAGSIAVTNLCHRRQPLGGLLPMLMLGVVLGQSGLVSLWAVFSVKRLSLRLAGAICVAALLWVELLTAIRGWGSRFQSMEALVLVLPPMLVVFALGARLRFKGVVCRRITDVNIVIHEAIQFTLKDMMLSVVAAGVLLTIARAVQHPGPIRSVWSTLMLATLVGVLFAAQTLMCLWAGLGLGSALWRLPVPLLVGAMTAGVFGFVAGNDSGRYVGWTGIAETHVLVTVVTLLAVRVAGYRLIRVSEQPDRA
jgi:hypothetical protein